MAQGGPSVPLEVRYSAVGVYNGPIPTEGPKTVPVALDFTTQTEYQIDFTMLQQRRLISELQAVFIDNFSSAQPLVLTVNGTNQRVVCPPQSQGIFPIFAPNPPRFVAQSTGGQVVTLQFLNVPITCLTWDGVGTPFQFTGSNALIVSDAALDAIISGGALAVSSSETTDGDNTIPSFAATKMFTGTTAAATAQTIIAGAPSWFATFVEILISPDAVQAAGGEFTVSLIDSSGPTTIAEGICFVPGSAPTLSQASPPVLALLLEDIQILGLAAGNLEVQASAALTTGHLIWNVGGGTTSKTAP